MRVVALAAAALLVAGCVMSERRYFDSANNRAPEADERRCRFESARGAVGTYDPHPLIAASYRHDAEVRLMRLCMEAAGYSERMVRSPTP
jgi:hypothetical protein